MTQQSFQARPRNNPVRPFEAMRAMRALLKDKEDTAQVFRIVRALSGNSFEDRFRDFCADPMGRTILAEKRSLLKTLSDEEGLKACPPGSLGAAYLDFITTENISAAGLVQASEEGGDAGDDMDPDRSLFGQRLRDMHDLWHVTTGYGRDGLGELCLLAFTYAQERNRGIGFIVLMALRSVAKSHPGVPVLACAREGYRIGRRAAKWLPAQGLGGFPCAAARGGTPGSWSCSAYGLSGKPGQDPRDREGKPGEPAVRQCRAGRRLGALRSVCLHPVILRCVCRRPGTQSQMCRSS